MEPTRTDDTTFLSFPFSSLQMDDDIDDYCDYDYDSPEEPRLISIETSAYKHPGIDALEIVHRSVLLKRLVSDQSFDCWTTSWCAQIFGLFDEQVMIVEYFQNDTGCFGWEVSLLASNGYKNGMSVSMANFPLKDVAYGRTAEGMRNEIGKIIVNVWRTSYVACRFA